MLMTTLHYASQNSQTETAMALVEAGADVNRKDGYGCGLRLYRRVVGLSQRGGVPSLHSNGAAGGPLRLCRNTALHYASMNGHTETAKAVVKAGADVRCKNTYG